MAFTKLEPTGVNTSATFTFSNVVVTGTTNLGAVGNITITGGTSGYVLSTDGSGSLSWVAQSGGGGGGSPGGSNRYVQFNDSGTFGGVSALQFDKAANTLTLNGNLTSNNANLGNLVTANYFTGTLINGNQPNITTVGALSGLTLLGNIIPSANNQFTIGNSSFRFKDLFLSGTSIFIGDQTISSDSGGIGFTGNITSTNANLGNLATSNYYTGNGTLLFYLNASNIGSGTIPSGILGNSTVYLGTTGIALNRTSGSQSLTGITSIDGYASTVSTNAQPNITSVGTLASVDVTGNVSTGGNLIGNGYYLSSLNGSNITGTVSTATTAGTVTTNAQPNITSVGALSTLTVSGLLTATGGGVKTSNIVDSTGTNTISVSSTTSGFVGNLEIGTGGTGWVSASNFSGSGNTLTNLNASNIASGTIPSAILGNSTVYIGTTGIALNRASASQSLTGITSIDGYATTVSTAAQPNITSLGTLASVSVTANVSAGNVLTNNLLYANGVAWSFGSSSSYTNANVATFLASFGSNTISTTGNVSAGNFIGNGQALTGLNASNIASGTIPSGILGNSTVYVGTTSVALNRGSGAQSLTGITSIDGYANTVSYATQSNITSLGTLTSLTISGNLTTGNGNVTGTLTVGTGTTGSISGANVVSANYFVGNGALLTGISGGGGGSSISNGTSNVNIAASGGNVTVGVGGTAGVVTFTSTGANITGYANIGNLILTKYNETVVSGGGVSGTLTPDAATGTIFKYTLNGSITVNSLTNAVAGTSVTLILTQDVVGGRTLTSSMLFAGGSKTLSTAGGSIDIVNIFYDGTTYYASLSKGYI